jgi:hypothetical protein
MEKSRYIEMGMRQRTYRPDGGDDARTASQAAATALMVGEKQAEEPTRDPLVHDRLAGRRGGRHGGPRAWISSCCRGGHPRSRTILGLHATLRRTSPLTLAALELAPSMEMYQEASREREREQLRQDQRRGRERPGGIHVGEQPARSGKPAGGGRSRRARRRPERRMSWSPPSALGRWPAPRPSSCIATVRNPKRSGVVHTS